MKEIWKDIKGYEGSYQVSNTGKIKSLRRAVEIIDKNGKSRISIYQEKVLKQGKDPNGYKRVGLALNGKDKTVKVHRIVAQTFIPNPENKPQVNHINGDKTDNNVNNLEWCTAKENIEKAFETGLKKKGKEVYNSKPVYQFDLNMNFLKRYETITEASKETKILHSGISNCCSGRINNAGGFIWKYSRIMEKQNRASNL